MVNADLHLPSLSIQGFRGIEALEIPRLGRVNLITGKNNTGKSSILEALRIFTQNAAPHVIYDVLRYREENLRESNQGARSLTPESSYQISSLFNGFPQLQEAVGKILFSADGKAGPMRLNIYNDWVQESSSLDTDRMTYPEKPTILEDPVDVPILVIETEEDQKRFLLSTFPRPIPRSVRSHKTRMPCYLVSAGGGEKTAVLGPLWDEVMIQGIEQDIVSALHIIDPYISTVFMVGDESAGSSRKAMVRAANLKKPVPLRSFGDGLNRLFVIVLSLVNAPGGLLLVDEFENGLHHSVQLDAWRMIFRLAKDLDIQVFATSHSNDAL